MKEFNEYQHKAKSFSDQSHEVPKLRKIVSIESEKKDNLRVSTWTDMLYTSVNITNGHGSSIATAYDSEFLTAELQGEISSGDRVGRKFEGYAALDDNLSGILNICTIGESIVKADTFRNVGGDSGKRAISHMHLEIGSQEKFGDPRLRGAMLLVGILEDNSIAYEITYLPPKSADYLTQFNDEMTSLGFPKWNGQEDTRTVNGYFTDKDARRFLDTLQKFKKSQESPKA